MSENEEQYQEAAKKLTDMIIGKRIFERGQIEIKDGKITIDVTDQVSSIRACWLSETLDNANIKSDIKRTEIDGVVSSAVMVIDTKQEDFSKNVNSKTLKTEFDKEYKSPNGRSF